MELLLIRHGESERNAGRSTDPDSPLTPAGAAQARCLAERLPRCDLSGFAGVTSPYARTADTAAEVARATGLSFVTEELVREWGVEATVGGRHYPAETTGELAARLGEFLRLYAGRKLVVVSHAAPIAVLTQLAWGETPTTEGRFWGGVGNCSLRWLRASGSPDPLRVTSDRAD